MFRIWIFSSKIIRSNNQSNATLWVLETYLIMRLLPLMIILITALFSSNTYNKTSWCEDWTFQGTQSMLFSFFLIFPGDFWLLSGITGRSHSLCSLSHVPKTETIRSHNSRARITSNFNPAPNQMISDFLELCQTEVCFLNVKLLVSTVWLPKAHSVPHSVQLWMNEAALRYWNSMDSVPVDKVLKRTQLDLKKRVPMYHACPKCLSALLCDSAFLWNG